MAHLRTFLSLLVLSAVCSGSLVVVNSGVEVTRGRSVFVTEKQLRISVDPTADCKVEAVLNEPVTQRVGTFTPQVFDCSFLEDELKYVHNGSPLLDEDSVMLRVYRFTSSDTLVETVVLSVRVVDSRSKVVELGSTPLVVPEFYGLSNAINRSVLSIQTRADAICTVRLMTSDTNTLTLGQLVREEDAAPRKGRRTAALCAGNKPCLHHTNQVNVLKTDCQDFLQSGLKYQHLSPPSPEIDYIPIRVELRDQATRALLETEALWLPVLIHGAVQNQPPQPTFMASFILEVDQFILTPLTTATLDAKDHETPQETIVFNVTRPPAGGYITHLDDHTKPSGSFTWLDLHELKVAYQPPNSSRTHRRNYEVEFQAIDGSYLTSPPIIVHVSIRAAKTNAPRVSWNTGLDLLEGQSRPITWEELQVVDNDNIDAVYLVAVDGPLHGRLSVRGGKAFMFRVQDLRNGVVVYHHSDSDTTRDHIVFRISDGRHSIRHRFPINILPKDDSPPFLINNVAVEVQEGGAVQLKDYMLLASDLDSSDDYILFQIVSSPRAGQLVKKHAPQQSGTPVDSFLQRDLVQGLIYYQHAGQEEFEDAFDVTLSDSHRPPNLSHTYTVVVHVFPVEDQLPAEVSGSVRSLTVKETEAVYITRAHLHFTHREHPDTDLTYVITRPCFSPLHPGMMDAGRVFYTDSGSAMKKDPMVPALKSFTQHAVNHMKVAFMPPMEDIGPEPLFVQFVFSVSDHGGGTVSGLIFNITVNPVDDQTPEAFTNLLRVEEGGGAFLTEEYLMVRDRDSQEEVLRVELQREADHGWLELQGRTVKPGDKMTLQDLRGLRLRYIHDDSETTEDAVHLKVTDGLNAVEVVLPVQVLPMNDEPPQLGGGLRGELSCEEGGRVQVTVDYLSATDRDSEDSRLTYMLARSPGRGELQRSGQQVHKFSQQDLMQGHVFYVHTGGEIGPEPVSDTVTLIISDGEAGGTDSCCHGDAPPPPVPLHGTLPVYDLNITVLPVNNKVPAISLGEIMLVVDEGSRACLCGGVLGASDPDTNPEELTFHLQTPPTHGFLENTLPTPGSEKSNAGLQVESFSLIHLTSGYINYVQSEHKGAEPTVDQMSISVTDGLHSSAPVPLYIIINPTNDETPSLLLADFTVKEGGLRELTPSILNALDLDAPPDVLTFTVVEPPRHGTLINAVYGTDLSRYKEMGVAFLQRSLPIRSFTLQELRQGMRIVYMHDDTETLKDAVMLRLTDGVHTVQGRAQVTVLPVNDETPRLLKNAGLELDSGEHRVISSVVLEVEDLDTPPSQVYFFVNAAPRFGKLQLKTDSGWTELSAAQNFTQDDVEMNRLRYTHTTGGAGFKGHDSFRFIISDLDNETPEQSFVLSVHTVYKGDIVLQSKAVRLMEGQRVILNTDILLASDSAGRPEELVYTVSFPPRHGLVHAVQQTGLPLLSFSQLDVAAHRVCYTHDNGHAAAADSFSFVVSNGDSSRNGTLHFVIEHGDRIPPTLSRNDGLRLPDGTMKVISAEQLQLTDPDTAVANLSYSVTRLPRHGKLLLHAVPLTPPLRFTQNDVDHLNLAYQHNPGSQAQIDTFYFLPSDGNNPGYLEFGQLREEPAVFNIQVDHVDRTPPSLTTRRSPSTMVQLADGSGRYGVFITSKHLQTSDPDSPTEEVEFSISRPPHFGYLENVVTGAYIKGRFTQKDVDQRAVTFIVPANVEVTADSFRFTLTDPAGNAAPPDILEVSWSRVELSATCYRTCETAGTLQIQIQRSGKSIDPAYVAIQVEEGSAKPGTDFTHSTASLIQFDPGVTVKTWNIYLTDDGLEENHETFTVTLRNPRNAVLGQRTSASVEIIDPRGGRCLPDDLRVDEDEGRSPPHRPPPLLPAVEDEDPVTDIEAELLWENRPHPPRGDVPRRRSDLDYVEGDPDPQDQVASSFIHAHPQNTRAAPWLVTGRTGQSRVHLSGDRRSEETVWTFHSLTPLRLEELGPGDSGWSWSPDSRHPQELQLSDASQVDHPGPKEPPEFHQSKAGRSVSSSCPDGWTHHRRRCYILSSSVASWASAERSCSLLFNSSLSSVRSRKDINWMWKFAGKKPFWIASSASLNSRSVPLSELKGAPLGQVSSNVGSDCVLVQNPRRWISTSCSAETQHRFICSASALTH